MELKNISIKLYAGASIEDKCRFPLHPLNEVKAAEKIIMLKKSTILYSNSPDFISAIKYLCLRDSIEVEFFLDGKSVGDDIEPLFESFNKAFDLLLELCPDIN